jgi:HlyD family secretion protein
MPAFPAEIVHILVAEKRIVGTISLGKFRCFSWNRNLSQIKGFTIQVGTVGSLPPKKLRATPTKPMRFSIRPARLWIATGFAVTFWIAAEIGRRRRRRMLTQWRSHLTCPPRTTPGVLPWPGRAISTMPRLSFRTRIGAGQIALTRSSGQRQSELRERLLPDIHRQLKILRGNLAVVHDKLDSLVIRAPVTGKVTAIDLKVGENRAPGQRLAEVTADTGMKLIADVDEFYLARVRAGQTAAVILDGKSINLTVRRVSPQVHNGQFRIDLDFDAASPKALVEGVSGSELRLRFRCALDASVPFVSPILPEAALATANVSEVANSFYSHHILGVFVSQLPLDAQPQGRPVGHGQRLRIQIISKYGLWMKRIDEIDTLIIGIGAGFQRIGTIENDVTRTGAKAGHVKDRGQRYAGPLSNGTPPFDAVVTGNLCPGTQRA